MSEAPLIGITTYRQDADWAHWRRVPADLLPAAYARSVAAAGGVPVLIPPQESAEAARAVVGRLDGLLIAGGADINPARYGQEPHPSVELWYEDRDASEFWLLESADVRGLPVLGICRGMQLMAVAAGGSLVQHLPDQLGHDEHGGGDNAYGTVRVAVEAGRRLAGLIASEVVAPCHHHQAVAEHPGYLAAAKDDDGVLQAIEKPGERFVLAVQWHPETDSDLGVFTGLVDAARGSR
ncbi:gamma-glutamyl-gamma-aminobutyrate hydrolase family protein [Arthrobacter sp. NPDC090010]|uniref:gamma-glutamyl-gamma-aminobutyrate hydrolase family protein n=1 Tax=Arthrobacter sp. NPDC090010 TaxID=3363942 RepID=UPI00380A7E93